MAKFLYKGRSNRGDSTQGIIEASSADAVATQLVNTGVTPIQITLSVEKQDAIAELKDRFGIGAPKLEEIILFSRQMYTLLKAGVPIIRAIGGLADTTQNRILAKTLTEIKQSLETGRDFAGSLSQQPHVFSTLYISIIQVGESSGQLDTAFLQIAHYLELERETRSRIKTALRYPIFVILSVVIAVMVINIFVIPQFASFFNGFKTELPLATRILMGTSAFTLAYWPYIFASAIAASLAVSNYIRTEKGKYKWDKAKLHLPLVGGIIKRTILGRFCRSFSMALTAGVPLIQAMTVVSRAVDNDYVSEHVKTMRNAVERGESLTRTAGATGLFTPLVIQMFSVGEETGMVDSLLLEVAEFYEGEVEYDLKALSASIEPILIVIIAVLVLILALAVFLPMWEMSSVMKGG